MEENAGWWGSELTEIELVAWLLYQEGSALPDHVLREMARIIRWNLRNGLKPQWRSGVQVWPLEAYTSLVNPNGRGGFDESDFKELFYLVDKDVVVDLSRYLDIAREVYNEKLTRPKWTNWWADYEIVGREHYLSVYSGQYEELVLGDGSLFYFGSYETFNCLVIGSGCPGP